ncbi:hypothetical protein D3C87_2150390 [compost metagenome]
MEGEPALPAEQNDIAALQLERAGRIRAFKAADTKQATVTERDRQYRRRKFCLVLVLMQSHPGVI